MVEVLPPKPVSGQVDYEFLTKLHKVSQSVILGTWLSSCQLKLLCKKEGGLQRAMLHTLSQQGMTWALRPFRQVLTDA